MFEVMERCFPDRYDSWLPKLKEMVPSLGTKLSNEPALFDEVWAWGSKVLGLDVSGPGASLEDVQPTEPAPIRRSRPRRLPDDGCGVTVAPRRNWAKDLDAGDPYELLKLRVEVFVVRAAPHTRSWTAATCWPKPGTSGSSRRTVG